MKDSNINENINANEESGDVDWGPQKREGVYYYSFSTGAAYIPVIENNPEIDFDLSGENPFEEKKIGSELHDKLFNRKYIME